MRNASLCSSVPPNVCKIDGDQSGLGRIPQLRCLQCGKAAPFRDLRVISSREAQPPDWIGVATGISSPSPAREDETYADFPALNCWAIIGTSLREAWTGSAWQKGSTQYACVPRAALAKNFGTSEPLESW